MQPGPLIVQSDHTVLLETFHPQYADARGELAVFAELERAPEHIHTYRITKLGLWNARAAGHTAAEMLETLNRYAKFPVPETVAKQLTETADKYGTLEISRDAAGALILTSADPLALQEVARHPQIAKLLTAQINQHTYTVAEWARGELKQQLLARGWPAADSAGYTPGTPHPIKLTTDNWQLRDYQRRAAAAFATGGSGVVVLPCGSGKTIVGAAAMAQVQTSTLILVTNTVSARQWRAELLARTDLNPDDIGEYSGHAKEIKPVTIATYQILTAKRAGKFTHLALLDAADWGLIIYDEVHLLPAPVFQLTADLQARRRLGLTATLVREDGREGSVFTLIGPKRFDAPWKELEAQGAIAAANCFEVRVHLNDQERAEYAAASDRERYRLAASCPAKIAVARQIIAFHENEQVLIIGQYLDQLAQIANQLDAPLITGDTPLAERERLFAAFRSAQVRVLVVSKVANFSVDLPDASVAIQISGAFGSRQEEAQRLGRVLRPKSGGVSASFYTLVTRDSADQEFALNRQRFLAEQGYAYTVLDAAQLPAFFASS